jgi:hypothetical protein
MIPMIGLMVSAYTIPRLLQMSSSADSGFIRLVSALGLLATIFLDYALLTTGSSLPKYP